MNPRLRLAYDAGVRDALQLARDEADRLASSDPAGAAALNALAAKGETNLTGWCPSDVLPANVVDLEAVRPSRGARP